MPTTAIQRTRAPHLQRSARNIGQQQHSSDITSAGGQFHAPKPPPTSRPPTVRGRPFRTPGWLKRDEQNWMLTAPHVPLLALWHLHAQIPTFWGGRDGRPHLLGLRIQHRAVLRGADQQSGFQFRGFHKQLIDIGLAVANTDHLHPGRGQPHGLFQGGDPLVAFFFFNGPFAPCVVTPHFRFGVPGPDCLGQHPQGQAGKRHRQSRVLYHTPQVLRGRADGPQAGSLRMRRKIQVAAILQRQYQGLRLHPGLCAMLMRAQNLLRRDFGIGKQTIARFRRGPIGADPIDRCQRLCRQLHVVVSWLRFNGWSRRTSVCNCVCTGLGWDRFPASLSAFRLGGGSSLLPPTRFSASLPRLC